MLLILLVGVATDHSVLAYTFFYLYGGGFYLLLLGM